MSNSFYFMTIFQKTGKNTQQGFNFVWFYMDKDSKEVCIEKHEKNRLFRYQNDVHLL